MAAISLSFVETPRFETIRFGVGWSCEIGVPAVTIRGAIYKMFFKLFVIKSI